MSDLLAARYQMAVSLGFHIIFAAIGMAMPFFMAVAHGLWLKTKNPTYLQLTKAWSKGVAIFFATGAVSGTVLAFELGLLWPEFMRHAGPIIGMPFSWEGSAFFLEAIALGIFLYGWGKVPNLIHWISGLIVGIAGIASGFFVICANAWMNHPTGFEWVNGRAINIDPWKAMFNPTAFRQGLHMMIAAFEAVGFGVAGVHALRLLRHPRNGLHRHAFIIALCFGSAAALVQPLAGDRLAKQTARYQPQKLAAMESLFHTQEGAPLLLGGIPSVKQETVRFAVKIPKTLSFLAHGDFNAEVKGLDAYPKKDWPPVAVVHVAFQTMIGLGVFLAALSSLALLFLLKQSPRLWSRPFLKMMALATPLGFIALEAGWVVTEVGRQPWIIYGVMRTKDAVTAMPGLVYTSLSVTALYLFLSALAVWLLARQVRLVEGDERV